MKRGTISGGNDTPFIIVFTDLDGTLLDQTTYGWEEAKPALGLCQDLNVPVVLVSSKTRAEMEPLRQQLGLSFPFVSENGGGIFFPKEMSYPVPADAVLADDMWKWSLGLPYDFLVKALGEICNELGWKIRGFSGMSAEEIAQLTGLDLQSARLAAKREYDEPFLVMETEEVDIDLLCGAAERRGLNITMGGRFYHLHGKNDKGASLERLIAWYKQYHREVLTIALGDSPNDFSMLKRADHPILVRSARPFPELEEMIPGLKITKEMGPKGWNSVVLELLAEKPRGGIS
jgi:mannosyl-3-phosphoglycerate phosphatase